MKLIDCAVCSKKTLGLRAGPGRTILHRNTMVPVPDDFELPECSNCGSRPIPWKLAKQLAPRLDEAWAALMRARVSADIEALGQVRPLYEWERLLNLSGGYLSKLKGEKTPSAPLVALLRLLANQTDRADEVEALWAGRPTVTHSEARITLFAVQAPIGKQEPVLSFSYSDSVKVAA